MAVGVGGNMPCSMFWEHALQHVYLKELALNATHSTRYGRLHTQRHTETHTTPCTKAERKGQHRAPRAQTTATAEPRPSVRCVVVLRGARHPLRAASDGSRGPLVPGYEAAERMRQADLEAAAAAAIVKAIDDGIALGVAGPVRELTARVDRLAQEVRDGNRLEKQTDRLDKSVTGLRSDPTAPKPPFEAAVAVLLLVLLGTLSPEVLQKGLYGQLLMKILPGAE